MCGLMEGIWGGSGIKDHSLNCTVRGSGSKIREIKLLFWILGVLILKLYQGIKPSQSPTLINQAERQNRICESRLFMILTASILFVV